MTEKKNKIVNVKTDGYNDVFNQSCGSEIASQTLGAINGTTTSFNQTQFYYENAMARRVIDVVPEEMVSPGFKLSGIKDDKAFQSLWDGVKAEPLITDCLCWSRLFGGAAILAIVNDNKSLRQEATPEGAILESIRVYDRYQIDIEARETNPRNPRYGMPKLYRIKPGGAMNEFVVHHSRLHVTDGERIPNIVRNENQGWGVSVLNPKLIAAIKDYDRCEELATQLLRRKQQAVWGAKGLADLCDDNEGVYAARLRLAQVDDNSGVGNTIGIDKEFEDYSVLNSDISGVTELLQQKIDRIVAYSGIHEIVLKNKNTGGVSSSQNTALQTFYKLIERKRNEDYKPILEFLLPFMLNEKEWSVEFEPLSIPSDKEKSEIFKSNAEAVGSLVDKQIIDDEEARDTLEALNSGLKLKDGSPDLPARKPEDDSKQIKEEADDEGDKQDS
ncbi:DUF1073 domain-containing protein [Gibbsiella quercinecans]|uniref:phage portal protein n=1 Tax=Gibbsiella quercinecans TaxID=929813 RepID=UPI00242A4CD9|nr:DUF1073 domain-containing protein [Gibbsiella quercinecans]